MKVNRGVFILPLLIAFAALAGTNDINVARQALRDGLWEVARNHAAKINTDEAKLVVLESLAAEERWGEVKTLLGGWKCATNNAAFGYYAAVVANDWERALKLLASGGSQAGAAESLMMKAELLRRGGKREAARELWSKVVSMTNAGERAYSVASMNLGEVEPLRKACLMARHSDMRKRLTLRLGTVLLKNAASMEEGEKLISAVVADSPDLENALDAYVMLADAHLKKKDFAGAEKLYKNAMEIWPTAAKSSEVAVGLGEALLRLGRREEALQTLITAEKCAKGDEQLAFAILRQGDALSELGRGDEAMTKYHEVMQRFPETTVAKSLKRIVMVHELEMQGREKYRAYRFEEAAAMFAKVAKEDASSSERMKFMEMLCLYGQGKDSEAEQQARRLVEESPSASVRADAQLWLAKFLYNRGQWKEASAAFVAASTMKPTGMTEAQMLLWAARGALVAADYQQAIAYAAKVIERYRSSPEECGALLVQCKALMELARYDEVVLVSERVLLSEWLKGDDRVRLKLLRADAYFAMGADNQARYQAALEGYREIWLEGKLSPDLRIMTAFKIGRTLEKLKRIGEAIDQLYTDVILAYRDGRAKGEHFGDEARSAFSRAALRLAEEFEGRGNESQAVDILRLVVDSDVPAAVEAQKRIERISKKGRFL